MIKSLRIIRLFALILSACAITISSSSVLAAEDEAYLLLNAESDGILSARDLVFTNVETGDEVWIRDLINLGRAGSPRYIMEPLPAGEYFLSSIYPMMNVNDSAPRIEVEKGGGVITILAGTVNYIGDFLFRSRDRGRGVRTSFDYEPNSNTLIAAVTGDREIFQRMDVVVSIPGNAPVPVDKKLLGL